MTYSGICRVDALEDGDLSGDAMDRNYESHERCTRALRGVPSMPYATASMDVHPAAPLRQAQFSGMRAARRPRRPGRGDTRRGPVPECLCRKIEDAVTQDCRRLAAPQPRRSSSLRTGKRSRIVASAVGI
jgi:hypothetical protein